MRTRQFLRPQDNEIDTGHTKPIDLCVYEQYVQVRIRTVHVDRSRTKDDDFSRCIHHVLVGHSGIGQEIAEPVFDVNVSHFVFRPNLQVP